MNIFNRLVGKPRKRSLNEKIDHIEEMVYDLTDTLDKIHMDIWDKLTAIQEQGAQRPNIVLGLPQPDGSMAIAGYEPFEDFEPYDEDDGEEVDS